MLINTSHTPVPVLPGTRILEDTMGLVGYSVHDPKEPWRLWTIQWLYAPIPGRRLGGVRAKLIDTYGFTTFCNQRDLEVLLGFAKPGARCVWNHSEYLEPDDPDWYGMCVDREDLLDDLYDRELMLRQGSVVPLSGKSEVLRHIHYDEGNDKSELLVLVQDNCPYAPGYADTEFSSINRRWASVEKQDHEWG